MSVNKLTYVLYLRVFLSFLRIIRGFDYPGKHISQPTRIIGSPLIKEYAKEIMMLVTSVNKFLNVLTDRFIPTYYLLRVKFIKILSKDKHFQWNFKNRL
jgi:hypothetical protein